MMFVFRAKAGQCQRDVGKNGALIGSWKSPCQDKHLSLLDANLLLLDHHWGELLRIA
jgi:hypothetical protein